MENKEHTVKLFLVFLACLSSFFTFFPIQPAYAGIPTVISAKIIGSNTIEIIFNEAVITVALEYSDLQLTAGGARNITLLLGSGTDTITLTFDGAAAAADETATIDITGPISVSTGQPLVPLDDHPITDGQVPLAPNLPTAAAGPIIDAAEETAGFNVVAPLGASSAVAGDTLTLLLGGSNFPASLSRILTGGDILAGQYTFNIASGQLGADGVKSITSRVTDTASNIGPQSIPLVLTLDAGIVAPSTNNSFDQIKHSFRTVYPQKITFSQGSDTVLTGKMNTFDTKIETKLIKVGEPLDLKINFPNNKAFSNIQKVLLIFDIHENFNKNKKDAIIIYDKFSGLKIIDKNEHFSDISLDTSSNKKSVELIFHIGFSNIIDGADFHLQYIDLIKNSRSIKIPKAIKVVEDFPEKPFVTEPYAQSDSQTLIQVNRYDFVIQENSINGINTPDFNLLEKSESKNSSDKPMIWHELIRHHTSTISNADYEENKKIIIPSGIKEQAFWWANEIISNEEFLKSVRYLENYEFLEITENVDLDSKKIPDWIKLDNFWWDNRQAISDNEFISELLEILKN